MLTLAAASALDRLLPPDDTELTINKKKASSKDKSVPDSKCIRTLSLLMYAGVCIFVAAAVSVCSVFALASYHNYPGGRAMQRLLNNHIYRHICNDTDSSLSSNHLVWSPDASYSSGGSSRPGSDSQDRQFSVHIDVAPAMTGVSR